MGRKKKKTIKDRVVADQRVLEELADGCTGINREEQKALKDQPKFRITLGDFMREKMKEVSNVGF